MPGLPPDELPADLVSSWSSRLVANSSTLDGTEHAQTMVGTPATNRALERYLGGKRLGSNPNMQQFPPSARSGPGKVQKRVAYWQTSDACLPLGYLG